jgi:hypothetical protein
MVSWGENELWHGSQGGVRVGMGGMGRGTVAGSKFSVDSFQLTVSVEEKIEAKRDGNTEFTEIGTQRSQREEEERRRLHGEHRGHRVRREEGGRSCRGKNQKCKSERVEEFESLRVEEWRGDIT